METGKTPAPPRPGRWLRIALVVSLALNLAVAGGVAGVMLRHAGDGPPPRTIGFGPWSAALSKEDRAALREAYRGERGRLAAGWRQDAADRAELLRILRADPFDPAAFDTLNARMDARMRDRMQTGERLLRERILTMTPAERAAFADRLEASQRHRAERSGAGRD
ncbi:periplasmic heavy metal sensor [Ruixingdingia sedimenti]|uniref:Periplasmic heavy metal sensor n=1 Tax=Ruixingdingia sedimenti TaxID=3073604 RepID=A0ABU1F565_9RHOB|nr:periplasmic heavy metal sensor [Xinfangfangia sp. LG-4]MDR5652020.1 periplasmic heavy metal sensor [Xinfangfangia sp. LG-4]